MEFKTEQEILTEMVIYAQENGLLNDDEDIITAIQEGRKTENQYILDLSTHAYVLSRLTENLQEFYRDIDINTAVGLGLDKIGELLNVYRYTAQPSVVECVVSTIAANNNTNIKIPVGTELTFTDFVNSNIVYTTTQEYTIPSGVTSITIQAQSNDLGSTTRISSNSVTGLKGFSNLTAANYQQSTKGRDIEEDDAYRERIKNWYLKNIVGTKQCLDDFLNQREGITDYRLIPQWDGVGTLKIVLDCLDSELTTIQADIQENCMLYTDDPVVCVLPTSQKIDTFDIVAYLPKAVPDNMTLAELTDLITGQARIYLEGGVSRSERVIKGLSIGEELDPSQLISFLLSEIPEVNNIRSSQQKVITCTDNTNKLSITNITVEYEYGI